MSEEIISVAGKDYKVIGKGSLDGSDKPKKVKCDGCGAEFIMRSNFRKGSHEFTNSEGTKFFHNRACKEKYIAELRVKSEGNNDCKENAEAEVKSAFKTEICTKCGKEVTININNEKTGWNMHYGRWCGISKNKSQDYSKGVSKNNIELTGSLKKNQAPTCSDDSSGNAGAPISSTPKKGPIFILNCNIFEFLQNAPVAYIDAFEPEKLKQLIIEQRSK